MASELLNYYSNELRLGRHIEASEMESLFEELIATDNESSIIALLTVWSVKGFTEDELFGLSTVMRKRMVRVPSRRFPIVDIVGTGGSRNKTFNVSTAVSFVVSGTGLAVAKHGNRAATSRSGSSDVLHQLQISLRHSPQELTKRLDRDGICFLFAPNHHSLSLLLSSARRRIGKPTIFNCVGPLCNPASPTSSLIGVSQREWLLPIANVLARLGTGRSWVVHAESGLDEIALRGATLVAEVKNGAVTPHSVRASDFGVAIKGDGVPACCDAARSAEIIEGVLGGSLAGSDAETLVLLNSAAAIYAAHGTATLSDAFEMARESVRSGSALSKLRAARARN